MFKIPIICVVYIKNRETFINLISFRIKNRRKASRKYYKDHKDEYDLIKKTQNYLFVNIDRVQGIREAENLKFNSVILDDGLQDYSVNKDIKISCFNSNQLIGNGLVLPSGPLRENFKTLKGIDIVVINGNQNLEFEKKILNINKKIEIFYSYYKATNIDEFKKIKIYLR